MKNHFILIKTILLVDTQNAENNRTAATWAFDLTPLIKDQASAEEQIQAVNQLISEVTLNYNNVGVSLIQSDQVDNFASLSDFFEQTYQIKTHEAISFDNFKEIANDIEL